MGQITSLYNQQDENWQPYVLVSLLVSLHQRANRGPYTKYLKMCVFSKMPPLNKILYLNWLGFTLPSSALQLSIISFYRKRLHLADAIIQSSLPCNLRMFFTQATHFVFTNVTCFILVYQKKKKKSTSYDRMFAFGITCMVESYIEKCVLGRYILSPCCL